MRLQRTAVIINLFRPWSVGSPYMKKILPAADEPLQPVSSVSPHREDRDRTLPCLCAQQPDSPLGVPEWIGDSAGTHTPRSITHELFASSE